MPNSVQASSTFMRDQNHLRRYRRTYGKSLSRKRGTTRGHSWQRGVLPRRWRPTPREFCMDDKVLHFTVPHDRHAQAIPIVTRLRLSRSQISHRWPWWREKTPSQQGTVSKAWKIQTNDSQHTCDPDLRQHHSQCVSTPPPPSSPVRPRGSEQCCETSSCV